MPFRNLFFFVSITKDKLVKKKIFPIIIDVIIIITDLYLVVMVIYFDFKISIWLEKKNQMNLINRKCQVLFLTLNLLLYFNGWGEKEYSRTWLLYINVLKFFLIKNFKIKFIIANYHYLFRILSFEHLVNLLIFDYH